MGFYFAYDGDLGNLVDGGYRMGLDRLFWFWCEKWIGGGKFEGREVILIVE